MTNWPEFDEHPQSVLVAVDGSGNRTYHVSLDEQQYNQARDAIAAMQWRPIETAPKDGTTVLIYYKITPNEVYKSWYEENSGLWIEDDHRLNGQPDLWMHYPLPPQPTDDL